MKLHIFNYHFHFIYLFIYLFIFSFHGWLSMMTDTINELLITPAGITQSVWLLHHKINVWGEIKHTSYHER